MKKLAVLMVFVLTVTTSGYAVYRVETGNFDTVLPGKVYRSGQLDEKQWKHYLQKYAIKSLLNLRGEHRAASWYQEEVRAANMLRVTHYDMKISANREVDNGTLDTILAIMQQAPKPLLVHCQAGSDRSGLITGVYLFKIEGQPAETASGQLSLLYGHFPYLLSKTGATDRSFWRYVDSATHHTSMDRLRHFTPVADQEQHRHRDELRHD
jgi:undecaprenyl-diphosphatase